MRIDATEQPQLLEIRGLTKGFPGRAGARRRGFHPHRRRDPRAARRERRRQVDADQGAHRRLHARRRQIRLDGQDDRRRATRPTRSALGIGTVYQEVNLLPEPVGGGEPLPRPPAAAASASMRAGEMRRRAAELLARLRPRHRRRPIRSARYSVADPADRRHRPRGRSLGQGAHPRRADREPRRARGRDAVRGHAAICKQRGIGIVFVTHFLDQVYAVCDRITVLRNGSSSARPTPRSCRASSWSSDDARRASWRVRRRSHQRPARRPSPASRWSRPRATASAARSSRST